LIKGIREDDRVAGTVGDGFIRMFDIKSGQNQAVGMFNCEELLEHEDIKMRYVWAYLVIVEISLLFAACLDTKKIDNATRL
jgi:hypothetical protein